MNKWKEERDIILPVPHCLNSLRAELFSILQDLIDSLSVYAHLAHKDDSREAAAMVLFQRWIDSRQSYEKNMQQIHRQMLKKMLDMVRTTTPGRENLRVSRQLVDAYLQEVEVKEKSLCQAQTELVRINLRLSSDARMLELLFHIHLEDFLSFYIDCLSNAGTTENSLLAIHFLKSADSCLEPVEA